MWKNIPNLGSYPRLNGSFLFGCAVQKASLLEKSGDRSILIAIFQSETLHSYDDDPYSI